MKRILLHAMTALLLIPVVEVAAQTDTDGIKIQHLSDANSLIRLSAPTRYLLLPIEESVPDDKIEILVDGNVAFTLHARLANSKTDYYVPLEISPYIAKGNVVLNVSQASKKGADAVCWNQMKLSDTFDTANTEKYRPAYHHTPSYGWMNDPNGMFYKDGEWHLYFQYNPYGSKWQNMTWGHSVSTDLVSWEQQPNAILPNGLGTVFSGSAAVDKNNTAGFGRDEVIAIYTSAGTSQIQSLAHSADNGKTFEIYPQNPVIATNFEARDPNFFWNDDIGKWNLVLAGAPAREILIYSSADMKNWTFESSFGKGYAGQDGVWECPDLVKLPVRGTDKHKWVLICNINPGGPMGGSATQYFVGDFDGHEFVCDNEVNDTRWMDYGKDHYATVTWSGAPDNRHTAIAWMSNWQYANDVPTMQFRSANTLPRDLELFTAPDGDLYLSVKPSKEVEALRGARSVGGASATATASGATFALPEANDGICEITMDYDYKNANNIIIELSNEKGEKVGMTFDSAKRQFAMDRRESGLTSFSDKFPTVTIAPTRNDKNSGTLRLFIDRCSVEAFDGDGRFAMTNLVFPTSPYTNITIRSDNGKSKISNLNIYPINIKKIKDI